MRSFLVQNLVTRDGRAGWQPNLAVLRRTMPELSGFPVVPDKAPVSAGALLPRGRRHKLIAPVPAARPAAAAPPITRRCFVSNSWRLRGWARSSKRPWAPSS